MPPNLEPAQGFHCVKVGVVVQQCVIVFDAVRSLQHVDGAGDGDAMGAELAIVLGGGATDSVAPDHHDVERAHHAISGDVIALMTKAAQYLKQREISDGDRGGGFVEQFGKLIDRRRATSTKVVNPDAGIDQDHLLRAFFAAAFGRVDAELT